MLIHLKLRYETAVQNNGHTKSPHRGRKGPQTAPAQSLPSCGVLSCSCRKDAGKVFCFKVKSFRMKCALQKGRARHGIPLYRNSRALCSETHARFCFLPSRHSLLSYEAQGLPPALLLWRWEAHEDVCNRPHSHLLSSAKLLYL